MAKINRCIFVHVSCVGLCIEFSENKNIMSFQVNASCFKKCLDICSEKQDENTEKEKQYNSIFI